MGDDFNFNYEDEIFYVTGIHILNSRQNLIYGIIYKNIQNN